ncbi:MAG TPA: pyridoxal phosphate-dependent aminotransferase [Epsilonproteobacteria bacterium]|nr:pyridoxal phosphate-dependent aminotransferase [Campylobacterota bacterium]
MLKLSQRSETIAQSYIRAMSVKCHEQNGINMAQGLCDLEVPSVVNEGAKEAMNLGKNIYTSAYGTYALRQEIAQKQDRWHPQQTTAEHVLVSLGATGAFYCTANVLLNPGDEVVLFEPYYGYHVSTLESLGCKVTFVRTTPPEYAIDFSALEAAITPNTRAILICNPSNPSGKVYTKEELAQIGQIVEKYDLTLFSDEMYEHFVYEGTAFVSARSIETLRERCVVISGFSKIYSITGWRLGYAIAPQYVIDAASHINDLVYVCAPAPLQYGVLKGLQTLPKAYYEEAATSHQKKRDTFIKVLNEVGFKAEYVKGAYYVLADISGVEGKDDLEKSMNLLEKTGIASVPARAFYRDASGLNLARFCFSKQEEELEEACRRLRTLL